MSSAFGERKGAFLGRQHNDPRVHTNNLYLEIAVGAGLLGLFCWLYWLWSLVRLAWPARGLAPVAGALASLTTFCVHGLVDAPLLFYSSGGLLMVIAGLAVHVHSPPRTSQSSV